MIAASFLQTWGLVLWLLLVPGTLLLGALVLDKALRRAVDLFRVAVMVAQVLRERRSA